MSAIVSLTVDPAGIPYKQNLASKNVEQLRLLRRKRYLLTAIRAYREQEGTAEQVSSRDQTRKTPKYYELDSTERRLLDELNQISRILEPAQALQPPRYDPADRLPFDLLVDIIGLSVLQSTTKDFGNVEISLDLLLQLTLVSKQWREVILNSPRLWRHIDLDDYNEKPDGGVKLCLALALTQHAPLTLSISSKGFTTEARSVISSISHRIRSINLVFCTTSGSYARQDEEWDILQLLWVLMGITSYHLLEKITFGRRVRLPRTTLLNVKAASPNLRLLKNSRCHGNADVERGDISTLEDLEYTLESSDTAEHLGSILAICRSVEIYDGRKVNFLPSGEETLSLVGFSYISYGTVSPSFINRLRNIVSLDVNISPGDLLAFADVLPHLERLYDLIITLMYGFEGEAVQGWDFSTSRRFMPNRSLKMLHFITFSEGKLVESPTLSIFDSQVASIFGDVVPSIHNLIIEVHNPQIILDWAGGKFFTRLSHLEYTLRGADGLFATTRGLSPTIQSLSTSNNSRPSHLLFLGANLETLDLTLTFRSDFKVPAALGLEACRHLRRLLLTVPTAEWRGIKFTQLQQLVLKSPANNACTEFCVHLAREPSLLPRLYSLAFETTVEIDILFIALEERNILAQDVSMITTVTLSGPPSPRFFVALRDLLGGVLSQRPSNYELSLLGNIEEYNDSTVPGCECCMKELRYCDEPVTFDIYNVPSEVIADKTSIYPLQSMDVIDTWVERHELWNRGIISRSSSCGRLQSWTITSDSIEAFTERSEVESQVEEVLKDGSVGERTSSGVLEVSSKESDLAKLI